MITYQPVSVVYARASHRLNTESCADQEARIRKKVESSDYPPVAAVYADPATSGSKPFAKRRAGRQLLIDVRRGDHVWTDVASRLGRNLRDNLNVMETLRSKGVTLHIRSCYGMNDVDLDTPMGRMIFNMLGAVAEHMLEEGRERIKNAKDKQKRNGEYSGGTPPFGMKVGIGTTTKSNGDPIKILVPHEKEQQLITMMVDMSYEMSIPQVTRELNKLGHRNRQGRKLQKIWVERQVSKHRGKRPGKKGFTKEMREERQRLKEINEAKQQRIDGE